MKDMETSEAASENAADTMSARFAHMVAQQSSMALMLLGKTAHPETGQTIRDLDAAKFFIDQLEMLEMKTKGNLTLEEAGLLKQSLTSLRMAYVEAVNEAPPAQAAPKPSQPAAGAAKDGESKCGPAPAAEPGEPESHKKFTKKY
jgi:Domain of unknown function (DUF1844)